MTYVALIRGINVGGKKIINMEVLRTILSELPLYEITTYIQSGNVLFKSDILDALVLETLIAQKIEVHFGFHVNVRITTIDELEIIVKENPFQGETTDSGNQPYVAFLSKRPLVEDVENVKAISSGEDRLYAADKVLFLWYAQSAATTKLTNVAIEKKLQLSATTRNWKSVRKLLELARSMS